jgi:hypothetical protein
MLQIAKVIGFLAQHLIYTGLLALSPVASARATIY